MTTSVPEEAPFVPPPSARRATDTDGEMFVWQPCRGVIVERIRGTMTLPLARALGDFYAPLVASGARFHMFVDLASVESYTRDAREYITLNTRERAGAVQAIHFLLGSKELALGISAFKLSIGDVPVHTYFDRASFVHSYEAAVQAAVGT